MKQVTVVIPNWNGENLLLKNLPKVIEAKNYKENNIKEIIIVDDASTDNSVKLLKKEFGKKVRLVKHSQNRGFSGAVNSGVKGSRTALVCLLNTDVIPTRDFLENTIEIFNKKDVFAVGLHEKGYGPSGITFKNGFFEHYNQGEISNISISAWASGGSAVFSRKKWRELKGLDESLLSPFYWEDTDLGYRAWKRGYQILWDPKAIVEHRHESVINKDSFKVKYLNEIKERNQLLVTWKNITSSRLINRHVLYLIRRGLRHPGYFKIIYIALKKWSLVKKARIKEKRLEKVSDEAVFSKFTK